MRKTIHVWCGAVTLAVAAIAQPLPSTDRFLVPVYLLAPIDGALGSRWVTELTILNNADSPAYIENFGPQCNFQPCYPKQLVSGTSMAGDGVRYVYADGPPAVVLLVKPEYVDHLVFQLRVRDTSRVAEGYGTWLPVVHQSQFATEGIELLDVPVDPVHRLMLRAYSLELRPDQRVRVRVFGVGQGGSDQAPDVLLADFPIELYVFGGASQPAYAQFPDLGGLPGLTNYHRVRVSLDAEGEVPIWGMITVTNNVTQEVTAVLPHARH